jgi:hypothetical protein
MSALAIWRCSSLWRLPAEILKSCLAETEGIHNPKPSEGQVHPTARSLTLGPSNRQHHSTLLSSRSNCSVPFRENPESTAAVPFSHMLLCRARYSSI